MDYSNQEVLAGARDSHKRVGHGDQPVGVEEAKAGQQVAWGIVAKGGVRDAAHAHIEEGLPPRNRRSAHPWTGCSSATRRFCQHSTHRDQDADFGGFPHDQSLGGGLLDSVCDLDQDHALQAHPGGVRSRAMVLGNLLRDVCL